MGQPQVPRRPREAPLVTWPQVAASATPPFRCDASRAKNLAAPGPFPPFHSSRRHRWHAPAKKTCIIGWLSDGIGAERSDRGRGPASTQRPSWTAGASRPCGSQSLRCQGQPLSETGAGLNVPKKAAPGLRPRQQHGRQASHPDGRQSRSADGTRRRHQHQTARNGLGSEAAATRAPSSSEACAGGRCARPGAPLNDDRAAPPRRGRDRLAWSWTPADARRIRHDQVPRAIAARPW